MPAGQFLGPKTKVLYTSDAGKTYVLDIDADLVLTNSGLTPVGADGPPANATPPPKRFKPRGVYWQGTADGFENARKFLVCGTTTAGLYATDASAAVTIDAVTGRTTGRRGEKLSF